jgi:hypothetical protein
MSTHCFTHDRDFPSSSQCPVCRAEEVAELHRTMAERQQEALDRDEERQRDEEQRHEEALEREEERARDTERRHEEALEREEEREREAERRHEEEIYKRNNPGDYKCPECLSIGLNRGAARCMVCRAVVGTDYWPPIYETERRQAEEEAARRKAAAEQMRAAQEAAAERKRAAQEAAAAEWERTAPERALLEAKKRTAGAVGGLAGGLAGALLGGIAGTFVLMLVGIVVVVPLVVIFGDKTSDAILTVIGMITIFGGAIVGFVGGGAEARDAVKAWVGRQRR